MNLSGVSIQNSQSSIYFLSKTSDRRLHDLDSRMPDIINQQTEIQKENSIF